MDSIVPTRYKLHLEPDLDTFTFKASAEIEVQIEEPIDLIGLHALDLQIHSCTIRADGRETSCPFQVSPEKEMLEIRLPKAVSGSLQALIGYSGKINDRMAGFYRSSYVAGGERKYIAVTQFQESDARRAFPCLDLPEKKAVFEIEMIVDDQRVAIANTPVVQEIPLGNGKRLVRFAQTPKMSTYLVFFGVGAFAIQTDRNDRRVRIVSLPGRESYTGFGLDFGRKALLYCEDYFAIPYPLPKLDLIAVPDFAFGAMENWGAITFRENLLLHYPEITSKSGEERICEVIAHEIVHQWFGNLVTPSDWKYLWLNESFATYFGYGIVDRHYPDWNIWHQFLNSMTDSAMHRDALKETFSIEIPSGAHVVINAATAPIIYNKGGSLIRQIEGYLGPDLFRKGLNHYLNRHAYACAASSQLWEAFEAVSEKPITRIVKNWIEQPGFPIIEVDRDGRELMLTQKRFTYLPERFDQTWVVPVQIRVLSSSEKIDRVIDVLMEERSARVDIGSEAAAYLINCGRTGFYRARYLEERNLRMLGDAIKRKSLPPEDRWGIENDLFASVKSGDMAIDPYLSYLDHFQTEDAFLPVSGITDHLFHLFLLLYSKNDAKIDPEKRSRIESLAKSFAGRTLKSMGYEPAAEEPHSVSLLRDRLLWHAVVYGSPEAESFVEEKIDRLKTGEGIPADIQKAVMQAAAWMQDEEGYRILEERFHNAQSEHERINILTAMGCFRQMDLLQRSLRFTLDAVPDRNKFVSIVSAAANPAAGAFLWEWYLSHRTELESIHPLLYERVITGIIPICGIGQAEAVKEFFDAYMQETSILKDAIRMSLERLETNRMLRLGLNALN